MTQEKTKSVTVKNMLRSGGTVFAAQHLLTFTEQKLVLLVPDRFQLHINIFIVNTVIHSNALLVYKQSYHKVKCCQSCFRPCFPVREKNEKN